MPGMLSPISLSAFSTAGVQPSPGVAGAVHRVRAVGGQPAAPVLPAMPVAPATPGRDADGAPARTLPRGSLLDLSV
jgi:hypothetical protein